ncbi:MAG TPA: peptidylprolyl isomerase [Propionibacteriaceae bacterium]|nr:peptidylprolyl isomerase [Propionibacteriaceae bacterium]
MITPYAGGSLRSGAGVDNFTLAGLSLPGRGTALWHSTTVNLHPTAIVGVAVLLSGCGQIPSPPQPPDPWASSVAASPMPSASSIGGNAGDICEYSASGDAARPVTPPPTTGVPTSGTMSYVLAMTNGKVTITLDRAKAPCTVNSFVSLADQGYFDDTACHRLADSGIFVLQCGDPTGTGKGGPGYEFANETDGTESYTEGAVAMANAGPGTNGSQFFLVWADSTSLDKNPNFTIFGKMNKASRDVVATMAAEGQDGSNPDGTGRPNNPSEITTVTRA